MLLHQSAGLGGLRPANVIIEGICGRGERLPSSLHVICHSLIAHLHSAPRRVRACLLAWRLALASIETAQHVCSERKNNGRVQCVLLEHSYSSLKCALRGHSGELIQVQFVAALCSLTHVIRLTI